MVPGMSSRTHAHEIDTVVGEPAKDALKLGLIDDSDSQDRIVADRLGNDALQRPYEALGYRAADHDLVRDGVSA